MKEDNKDTDFFEDPPQNLAQIPIESPFDESIFEKLDLPIVEEDEKMVEMSKEDMRKLIDNIWIEKSKEGQQKEFTHVFAENDPSETQKKNTNLHKFIIKVFLKYYENFREDKNKQYEGFMAVTKKKLKKTGYKNYKLSDLEVLFG